MAPLSFLEFDISHVAALAYPARFCWISLQMPSAATVSAP